MKTNDPAFDWRNDASDDNKRAVVAARFNGETPDYLWYELGGELRVNDAMLAEATAPLFGDKKPGFGDIETHPSGTASIVRCLRVRNATNWQPKLNIGGRDCYLYLVGHADDKRHFSFEEQWVRARFLPGTRVASHQQFRELTVGMNGEGQYKILPYKSEVFVVVETHFVSGMKQCFNLSELAGTNPALANFISTHANGQGVWSIFESNAELEVVVVTDADGKRREFCANMFEEVAS